MESDTATSSHATEQTGYGANADIWSHHQPDTLLLQQYFNDRRGKTDLEPEKRLMLAILEDAIECFQDHHSARQGKRKQIFNDVQSWIFHPRSDWVFGFANICSALGFDPEYIRKGLVRWSEKQLSRHRRAPERSTPRYRILSEKKINRACRLVAHRSS